MKRIMFFLFVFGFSSTLSAQPVLDGTFDGASVWGPAVASNTTAGWSGANAIRLYATSDEDYIYFGAEISADSWMRFGFLINTGGTGGIPNEVWNQSTTYDHDPRPKFVIKGNLSGDYAELREWDGATGHNLVGAIAAGDRGISTSFVEVRLLKSTLDDPENIDLQFYITGNEADHGTFNSVPADSEANAWNMSSNPTSLSNYAEDVDFSTPASNDEVEDAPDLNTPANEATGISSLASFSWDEVDHATDYRLQISVNSDLSSPAINTVVASDSYTVPSGSGLLGGTTYYWRVQGLNGLGDGPWSEIRSFTTVPSFAVYFNNSNSWTTVNAYAFDPGNFKGWPGEEMSAPVNGWYSYNVPSTFGKIIFNDGTSQTDDLERNTTGWYDGNAEVWYAAEPTQVTGNAGWRMLSMPAHNVSLETLAGLNLIQGVTGASAFYDDGEDYDGSGANIQLFDGITTGAYVAPSNLSDQLASGTGFLWYMYNNDIGGSKSLPFWLDIQGDSRNNDNVSVALGTAHAGNWNLIGNPYSYHIDVNVAGAVLSNAATGGALQSTVPQVWNPETGSWATPEVISVFQGFFVQNDDATGLTFTPDMLDNAASATFYNDIRTGKISFQIQTGEHVDQAATLYFHEEANDNWDLFDALKLTPLSDAWVTMAFVGELNNETVLKAQESRNLFTSDAFSVPVSVQAKGYNGKATISWGDFQNIPEAWQIELVDTETGSRVNLRNADSYSFDISGADSPTSSQLSAPDAVTMRALHDSNRFVLHVSPTPTSAHGPTELPTSISLSQNYPNPFNPTTVISYDLPENAMVRLTVYDVLGRQVATLVNEAMPAGSHQVNFDASHLSSGMYLYRLQTGNRTLTRTMSLIK